MPDLKVAKPVDWNIVISGAWNIAILTPDGIAKRLFKLEPKTPVEVQVAMDGRAPVRVKHGNITVQPSPHSLIISPQNSDPLQMEKSIKIAKRALKNLPETPFSAAGLNFRYQFDNIPDSLIKACNSEIDDKLSDENFQIEGKALMRQIAWKEGVLNLNINEESNSSALLLFNYHKNSTSPKDLSDWLGMYNNMLENTKKILGILNDE